MNIHFEHGKISPNIKVLDAVIRTVEEQDEFDEFPIERIKLQARLENSCGHCIDHVTCDVSYYDSNGGFLGLDMTDSLDLDGIDPGEVAPVDLDIEMPDDTARCILNIHSRRLFQESASPSSRAAADAERKK